MISTWHRRTRSTIKNNYKHYKSQSETRTVMSNTLGFHKTNISFFWSLSASNCIVKKLILSLITVNFPVSDKLLLQHLNKQLSPRYNQEIMLASNVFWLTQLLFLRLYWSLPDCFKGHSTFIWQSWVQSFGWHLTDNWMVKFAASVAIWSCQFRSQISNPWFGITLARLRPPPQLGICCPSVRLSFRVSLNPSHYNLLNEW